MKANVFRKALYASAWKRSLIYLVVFVIVMFVSFWFADRTIDPTDKTPGQFFHAIFVKEEVLFFSGIVIMILLMNVFMIFDKERIVRWYKQTGGTINNIDSYGISQKAEEVLRKNEDSLREGDQFSNFEDVPSIYPFLF